MKETGERMKLRYKDNWDVINETVYFLYCDLRRRNNFIFKSKIIEREIPQIVLQMRRSSLDLAFCG